MVIDMKKRIICMILIVTMLLTFTVTIGNASGELGGLVIWSDDPNGYIHFFDDCTMLLQENEYQVHIGKIDAAASSGKDSYCRMCFIRLANKYNGDPRVVCQNTLSALSDSELQYFISVYSAEQLRRGNKEFILYPGTYTVGQDIPAGSWVLETQSSASIIAIYKNMDTYQSEIQIPLYDAYMGNAYGSSSISKLDLLIGNVIVIDSVFTVKAYEGITELISDK